MNRHNLYCFALLVGLPLALGAAIYIGWRSTTLLVFDAMHACGVPSDVFRPNVYLPATIQYCFPDGCWVFAGTSWMLIIWGRVNCWVCVCALLALAGEFGQMLGFVSGTFDWYDIKFCAMGFVLALLAYRLEKTYFLCARITCDDLVGCR